VHAAQEAAVQQQLAVLDAFIEDFKIAKRAHTLRSKQVRRALRPLFAHPSCGQQGSTFDARKIDALTDDTAFILQVMLMLIATLMLMVDLWLLFVIKWVDM
jgi:hypothetical protein